MKKQLDPTLSVRVPQHLIDAVEEEAAARGLPRADYLRATLRTVAVMGSAVIFDPADIPHETRTEYMARIRAEGTRRRYVDVLYPPEPPQAALHVAEPEAEELKQRDQETWDLAAALRPMAPADRATLARHLRALADALDAAAIQPR